MSTHDDATSAANGASNNVTDDSNTNTAAYSAVNGDDNAGDDIIVATTADVSSDDDDVTTDADKSGDVERDVDAMPYKVAELTTSHRDDTSFDWRELTSEQITAAVSTAGILLFILIVAIAVLSYRRSLVASTPPPSRPLPPGRLRYATFTVPPQLSPPNRIGNEWNDSFVPKSDNPPRFQRGIRGAIVSLFGPGQSSWFKANWPKNEENLLAPMRNESDFLIFYTMWPNNVHEELLRTLRELGGFNHVENDLYERSPTLKDKFDLYATDKWITKRGVTVYTIPVATNLPRYMMENPGHLEDPDWLQCIGWRLGLDYILLSGAVWPWQLWHHPVVTIGYEYWLKMDLDLIFHDPIPQPIFTAMRERRCKFLHSWLKQDEVNCSRGSYRAVLDYSLGRGVRPVSSNESWYQEETWMAYGNLMGLSLDWANSIETRAMTDHLYENVDGFFHHRWTDQQVSLRLFAQYYHVPTEAIAEPGRGDFGNFCDFHKWRGPVFNHKN